MAKRRQATLRSAEALKLRLQGCSYSDIGSKLGISTTKAYEDVQDALQPERQASEG